MDSTQVHASDAQRLAEDLERVRATVRLLPAACGNPALNRLTDLAARLLGSASAQVSLLTTEQLVAAGSGTAHVDVGTTRPLSEALCTITTSRSQALAVDDAPNDDRVRHLEPVAAGAIGSYLGVPLVSPTGPTIGALCVYNPSPRPWSAPDIALLAHLASSVVTELELAALTQEYDASRLRWDQDRELVSAATTRLELLASAGNELSATLDAEDAVARLAQLVVPVLGDWCVVTVIDGAGPRDVASWHVDPEQRGLVEQYAASRFSSLQPQSVVRQVLATGEAQHIPYGLAAAARLAFAPGPALDAVLVLCAESGGVLPLLARGRMLGALTIFRGPEREAMSDDDFLIAGEVASRAAMALDNARLYAEQRSLAEGLQRSLLTEPPEPDHAEIVVRYVPAAEAASVGGDWFDAFLQADGATVLVIGDVVGHDTEAAAAMGQLRGLLRGIAWHSGAGPADVLTSLDAAIEGLQVPTTATAVVARIEQTPDELAAGQTRLRWSNAGHPPPMVIAADGSVNVLSRPETDLLLGVDPLTSRSEFQVSLERGSTVLLYTDGLIERHGQDLDTGLALLRDLLVELAPLPLDGICDALLERLLPERAEDDVALVAVRLHRQDRPRPAEAGPTRVPPEVPQDPA